MNRPLYQQQDPELRRLKEAFVSNLQGTTRWEVFCVLSSLPLCLLTAAYIEARVIARLRSSSQLRKHSWPIPKFAFEFGGVVLPLLIVLMSVAPAEPAFLLLFLLWGSLALKLWMRLAHGPASRQHMGHMLQHMTAPRKRFVSAFRGGVMAATCLAILGVDFPAFPRRYAKAEGFGGGVMDVGVGAIIFAGGLVAAVAAGAAAASTGDSAAAAAAGASGSSSHASSSSSSSTWLLSARVRLLQLLRGVKAAIPLLLLGGGREIATAIVGYQAHLGEYGLNWNFFYTIAAVTLLTLAVPVPSRWLGPLGLGLTAAHQVLLSLDISKIVSVTAGGTSSISLQQYLASMPGLLYGTASSMGNSSSGSVEAASAAAEVSFSSSAAGAGVRSLGAWLHLDLGVEARQAAGFWASNKEGLGSLPGYWALYLLGAAVGHQLGASCAATAARARAQLASSSSSSRPGGVAAAVGEAGRLVWAWVGVWWLVDLGLWGLLAAVEVVVEPVSRRTCNFPYVLWTCAQCLAWLLLVVMADLLTAVICSSSGGCGTTAASTSTLAPAPATALHAGGSGKGSARRSLEAAVTAAAAVSGAPQQLPDGAAVGGSGGNTAASAAAGQRTQLAPPSPPKAAALQRRSVGKRGGGSSPVATAAAGAAAAPFMPASGSSSIAAGSAAAAAAVVDSQHSSSSSREGSPRQPAAGRSNRSSPAGSAGAHSSPKSSRSDKGSSPKGGSEASSGSGSGATAGGSGTPVRSRRQGSRLQQPHLQACQPPPQQRDEAGHGSSGSSGGPMRLMLAFNRNMLALFLIANLLTGAVNLSINTLDVGSWAARVIVGVYMLLLCSIAVLLDKHGITVKAW